MKRAARLAVRLGRRAGPDAVALSGLVAAAVFIDRDFLTTGDYPVGLWGEWLGHAYRVRLVQEYGVPTWDHAWAGGISPFQTYQFVPHVVTALVSALGDASVQRTMLLAEALLIFWVRSSGYVAARLVGLPQAAALFAGVVTFGTYNYAAEMLTFSTLWGLALVPLLLVAVWRYRSGPQIYLVAAAAGLSIYVHPHAALAGVVALIAVFLAGPVETGRLGRLALQGVVVALAAGFFWVPAFFSAKPPMQDPASADVQFLRGIFEGNVDRINDVVWLMVPVVAVTIAIFRGTVRRPLLLYVAAFLAITAFLIAVSYAGVGPEPIRLMQSVRLLNLLPLGLGLLGAIAIDGALRGFAEIDRRRAVVSVCAVAVAAGLFVPMFRFAADRGYEPAWYGPDPLAAWFEEHDYGQPGRVWMDGANTSWYTFWHFGELRSARSAFVQGDWSLLARPLQEGVIVGDPDWRTTEEYLRAIAVSYLLVSDNTAAGRQLHPGGEAAGSYQEILRVEAYPPVSLYEVPWVPVEAFVSDAEELPALHLPRTTYKTDEERAMRDELTRKYNEFAYSTDARPVSVAYPSATTMEIRLDDLPPDQYLVISENWDRSWRAQTQDGRSLRVERYGPNYIGVDLSPVEGDVVVRLTHGMSWDWKLGIALTLMSLPLAGGLMMFERRGGLKAPPLGTWLGPAR